MSNIYVWLARLSFMERSLRRTILGYLFPYHYSV
jgi:hypothetical protein